MRNATAQNRPTIIDRAYARQILKITRHFFKAPFDYMDSRSHNPSAVHKRYCTIWAIRRLITRVPRELSELIGRSQNLMYYASHQIDNQRSVYPEIKKETDALLDACERALGSCPHCGCSLTTKIVHVA